MRKKTLHRIWDYVLWGGLTLLPIFAMFIVMFRTGEFVTLSDAFSELGIGVLSNNFITTGLDGVFGANGVLPIFTNTAVFDFVAYYCFITLVHLFTDFIMFIPNYARKWINYFTGSDE